MVRALRPGETTTRRPWRPNREQLCHGHHLRSRPPLPETGSADGPNPSTRACARRATCTIWPFRRRSRRRAAARRSSAPAAIRCPSARSTSWPTRAASARAVGAITSFQPTATLAFEGLQNQYRTPGIGAPVAASVAGPPPAPARGIRVAPRLRVPSTALLEIPQARRQLANGDAARHPRRPHHLRPRHGADRRAKRSLEFGPDRGAGLQHRGVAGLGQRVPRLPVRRPVGRPAGHAARRARAHRRGRIPVVFVHGTASSPARWAQHVERARQRPSHPRALPVLVLLLRHRQSDRVLRLAAAGGAQAPVHGLDPRGGATRRSPHGGDRPQPGRAPQATAGDDGRRKRSGTQGSRRRARRSPRTLAHATSAARCSSSSCRRDERVVFIATPHRGSYLDRKWSSPGSSAG